MPAGRQPGTFRLVRWRPSVVDGLVATAGLAISVAVLATSDPVPADVREPHAAAYALVAVANGAVLLRRRNPALAVAAGVAAGFAYAAAEFPVALAPVYLLSVYTAASVLPARPARGVLVATTVVGWLTTTLSPGPTDLSVPALTVAVWMAGNYIGSRQAYTAELEAKNRLLEQAQLELAEQAVTEERLRIARELHDVVAHTMSVVAVHAGSGRMVAEEDPAAARQALATIEASTRSALLEMRRLLGVLRGAGGQQATGLAPAPGLSDLDALVADVVKSGVTVEVRVEGQRPDVPPGVDLSAYRIVQEALTNVIKHAGRARATVVVRYSNDAVVVEIDDDGPGVPALPRTSAVPGAAPAGGHGLAGMAERVAIYDGALEAGPRPAGGFRVVARLLFGGGR